MGKRDEDLNITLIIVSFSGHVKLCALTRNHRLVYSTVISAFVVVIQPQLQPDPGKEFAALLRVLLHNMNKTAFGTTVPIVPEWTGPPSEIVATQVLLFLSLASMLSSVLFALLPKQLLGSYATVISRKANVKGGKGRVVHPIPPSFHSAATFPASDWLYLLVVLLLYTSGMLTLWPPGSSLSLPLVPFHSTCYLVCWRCLSFSHLWELWK